MTGKILITIGLIIYIGLMAWNRFGKLPDKVRTTGLVVGIGLILVGVLM